MLKHLSTALAVSTALTAGVSGATIHDFSMTEANRQAAATYAAHANARTHREQTRWWDDFRDSGKNIVDHVADISASNPKAAMWFLLTGGRDGFADREATPEERIKLETAMKNVAIEVYKSSRTAGAEMWRDLTEKYNQGHAHVQMLYKEVADLKETVRTQGLDITRLNGVVTNQSARIGALETEVASLRRENGDLRGLVQRLEERLEARDRAHKEETEARDRAHKETERAFHAKIDRMIELHQTAIRDALVEQKESLRDIFELSTKDLKHSLKTARDEKAAADLLLTAEREEKQRLRTQYAQEKEQLVNNLRKADADIGEIRAAAGQKERDYREKLERAESEIIRLRAAFEDKEQNLLRTTEGLERKRQELREANQTASSLLSDLEKMERELGITKQHLTESDAKVAQMMNKQQNRGYQRTDSPEDGRGDDMPDPFQGDDNH